jgi:hypothetical protein
MESNERASLIQNRAYLLVGASTASPTTSKAADVMTEITNYGKTPALNPTVIAVCDIGPTVMANEGRLKEHGVKANVPTIPIRPEGTLKIGGPCAAGEREPAVAAGEQIFLEVGRSKIS